MSFILDLLVVGTLSFVLIGSSAYIAGLYYYQRYFRGWPSWGVKLAICALLDVFDYNLFANLLVFSGLVDVFQTLVCTLLVGPLGALCLIEILIPDSVPMFGNWLPMCIGACLLSWRYRIRF